MNQAAYEQLRQDVEGQTVRGLRRFLDYGKRVRQTSGLDEMGQWIGRILHDQEGVYSDSERALAFEVGACEWLARRWVEDAQAPGGVVTVIGGIDKIRLLRLLLVEEDAVRRRGLQQALRQRYGKLAAWIDGRALSLAQTEEDEDVVAYERLLLTFVADLEEVDPLDAGPGQECSPELAEAEKRQLHLQRELGVARARAERAVERLEDLEEEMTRLRRSLREERENGEKLRHERSRRIKIERDAREAAAQLQRLRAEYARLDQRLRDSVRRQGPGQQPLLEQLQRMSPGDLLGLGTGADEEAISQARRRFAGAFHSDRAARLPPWVADLFDHLLGLVNAACDRARR